VGFYIRKSFKSGPLRLNLSKSGLGVSAGVKGARIGTGPRGSYVHAGRGGLYYRQNLGTKSGRKTQHASSLASGLGILIVLAILIYIVNWFTENPHIFFGLTGIFIFVVVLNYYNKYIQNKRLDEYKTKLDNIFILNKEPLTNEKTVESNKLKKKIKSSTQNDKVKKIEEDVYNALLDKIIEDDEITPTEKEYIQKLESIIDVSENVKDIIKKEIFKSYYFNAIQDREITQKEIDTLKNISSGLSIGSESIKDELDTVEEIIRMQKLSSPLEPIPSVPIKLQRSETPYYLRTGKVLSKRKANKKSGKEYEYSIKREGTLIITNKRIMVIKEGTTSVKMSDIVDVDVDIDEKIVILSKATSSVPTIIQVDEPLYCGKIIDLLVNNEQEIA